MTPAEATAFAAALPKSVARCDLRPYVSGRHGFTAVVIEGFRGAERFAVKIHHPPTVVATGGVEALRQRFERQLRVHTNPHPNIVRVFEVGHDPACDLHYVLMEFVDSPSLRDVRDRIPPAERRSIIAAIASAALHLERLGLVHRDIKPGNIGISADFKQATLLDLGVLRPIGTSDLTIPLGLDPFVATPRYAPPEFLANVNEDTTDGWRAVTFYQLGAIAYEVVTGKQLFAGIPDERLRDVVMTVRPTVEARGADRDLALLARNCLEKDWELRLKLVRWEDFNRPLPVSAEARIAVVRSLLHRADAARSRPTWMAESQAAYRASRYVVQLSNIIRRACQRHPNLLAPRELQSETGTSNSHVCAFQIKFPSTSKHFLPAPLVVEIRLSLLDEKTESVQVDAQASWTTNAPWFTPNTFFRGAVDSDELLEVIEGALLLAMSNAIAGMTTRSETGREYVSMDPSEPNS